MVAAYTVLFLPICPIFSPIATITGALLGDLLFRFYRKRDEHSV
jgi:hypothetical protein